jgi:hypothetical protein
MLRVVGPLEVDGPDGPVSSGGRSLAESSARFWSGLGQWSRSTDCSMRRGAMLLRRARSGRWSATSRGCVRRLPMPIRRVHGWNAATAATGWSSRRSMSTRAGWSRSSLRSRIFQRSTPFPRCEKRWPSGVRPLRLPTCRTPRTRQRRRPASLKLHGSAAEALVAAHLEVGDPGSAAAEAEARLCNMPFRERLWDLLVLALYRQGRQGEALEAYRRARDMLGDELGVDPGPRLRELEATVLAHCKHQRAGQVGDRLASRLN